MNDNELLKYFIGKTDERFNKIDEKLDILLKFKWQIGGAVFLSSILMSFALNLLLMSM